MLVRSLLISFALIVCSAGARANSTGSIFVVDRFGLHAEGNNFTRPDAVYLAGGAGPACSGPGLADGDYYFQITDPEGTVLLSNDPVAQRSVRVIGGYVAQYLGGKHLSSPRGPCGSRFVRLFPFLATPYPGGEYKVWLTRVTDYDPLGTSLFGFDPALSKSENFRILGAGPQCIVRGHKFYDHDGSGTWNPLTDPLEVPIGGWRVELRRNGMLDGVTFTDQDGWYIFIRDRDASTYEVREISPNGFVNDATPGATWLAKTARSGNVATSAEYVYGPEFGNVNYEVSVAAGRPVSFWAAENDDDDEACLPGTGCELLFPCEPVWRAALTTRNGLPVNLRRSHSTSLAFLSVFVPPTLPASYGQAFEDWESFANSPTNDHAGFLLSREVGAAILNNTCGFMQGSVYINRFQDGVLVSLDEMLVGAIGLLSTPGAGQTRPGDPYQALRALMIGCTNEFGRINETGDPSSPQVVYRTSEIPPRIATPY